MCIWLITFHTEASPRSSSARPPLQPRPASPPGRGPVARCWPVDVKTSTYGGVYLFEDERVAREALDTAESAAMVANELGDVQVREFATIAELDAVTSPGRLSPSPA